MRTVFCTKWLPQLLARSFGGVLSGNWKTSDGLHSSDLVVRNNFPGSVDWSHHEPIKLSAPGSVVHTQRWGHGSINWSPTPGYKKRITSGYNYRALTRKRRPSVGMVAFVGCRSWRPVYDCNLLHWIHKKKALSLRVCEVSFLNVLAKCKFLPILKKKTG